jgi:hypothetical protein
LYLHVLVETQEVLRGLTLFQRTQHIVTVIYFILIPILLLSLRRILVKQIKVASYEQQISRHKIELQNFQLTIRPHFL